MPLTASGFLSVPLNALRKTIAASATFREVVGSTNATAAEEHVYLQLANDEEETGRADYDKRLKHPRPRAVVATNEDWMRDRNGVAQWQPTGTLLVTFEFPIPKEYQGTTNDECLWFLNQIGAILSEMETARDADTAGDYLPFHRYAFAQDPMPADDSMHVETFWGCELEFQFF